MRCKRIVNSYKWQQSVFALQNVKAQVSNLQCYCTDVMWNVSMYKMKSIRYQIEIPIQARRYVRDRERDHGGNDTEN